MKTLSHTFHYHLYAYEELSEQDRLLVEAAKAVTEHSYAPYSLFRVGAAVRLEDGTVVTGTNQENAAYPSGLCAERTALFYAGSAYSDKAVISLAIAAYTNGEFTQKPVSPCGACRQVMLEMEQRHQQPMRIVLYGTEAVCVIEGGVADLLPLSFSYSIT